VRLWTVDEAGVGPDGGRIKGDDLGNDLEYKNSIASRLGSSNEAAQSTDTSPEAVKCE